TTRLPALAAARATNASFQRVSCLDHRLRGPLADGRRGACYDHCATPTLSWARPGRADALFARADRLQHLSAHGDTGGARHQPRRAEPLSQIWLPGGWSAPSLLQ